MLDVIQFRFALPFWSCMTADQLRNAVVPKSNTRPRAHHSSQPRTPHWTETVRLWFREIRAIQRNTWLTSILHIARYTISSRIRTSIGGAWGTTRSVTFGSTGRSSARRRSSNRKISSCGVRCGCRFHSLESPRPRRRTAGCAFASTAGSPKSASARLLRSGRSVSPTRRPDSPSWGSRRESGSWSSARWRRRSSKSCKPPERRSCAGWVGDYSRVRRRLRGRRAPGIARPARGAHVEDRALRSNLDAASKRATSNHRGGYDGGRKAGRARRRQSGQLLRHADGRKVRDPGRKTTRAQGRRQAIEIRAAVRPKTPPARAVNPATKRTR